MESAFLNLNKDFVYTCDQLAFILIGNTDMAFSLKNFSYMLIRQLLDQQLCHVFFSAITKKMIVMCGKLYRSDCVFYTIFKVSYASFLITKLLFDFQYFFIKSFTETIKGMVKNASFTINKLLIWTCLCLFFSDLHYTHFLTFPRIRVVILLEKSCNLYLSIFKPCCGI